MAGIIALIVVICIVDSIIKSITTSKVIPYIVGCVLYLIFIKYFVKTIKNTFKLYRETKKEIDQLVIDEAQPISNEYNLLSNVEIVQIANGKRPKKMPDKCVACGAAYTYDRKTFSPNCQYCGSVVKINPAVLRELNRLKKQEDEKEIAYQQELDKKNAIRSLIKEKRHYLILTRWRIVLYFFLFVLPLVGIFVIVPLI